MYLGKRKIFNLKKYEGTREKLLEYKPEATFIAFSELEGLINKTQLAEQYFERSRSWINKRLHGCIYCKDDTAFNEAEFRQLTDAFRDIAKRLMAHADEIDAAKLG